MAPSTSRLLLVGLVSLALATNAWWLFPDAGDTQYTYERSELVPQGDDVEYRPVVEPSESGYRNHLDGVGCESVFGDDQTDPELTGRTCAFEQSIADDGPVTVEGDHRDGIDVGYVELDDGYYHRTSETNGSSVTLTLEPLSAEQVLANVSGGDLSAAEADRVQRSRVAVRAVVSGDPVESGRSPNEVAVGQVYTVDNRYYAAFVVDSGGVEKPVPDALRVGLVFVGVVGLLSAVLLLVGRLSVEEW